MRKMAKVMSVLRATFQFNAQNYAGTILSIWFSVRLWSSTVADCCIKTSPEGVDFVAVALKIWIILEHESDLKNFLKHAVAKEYISVSYTYFSHEEISWMFSYPYFRNNFLLYRSFYFGLFNLNGLGPNFIAVALVMVVMLQTHKSFNGYLRISLNAAKSFFPSWWQFW